MQAKAEAKKQQVIAGLIEVRRQMLEVAAALPEEKQDLVFLGVWSVKDLLAHLVGWDAANLEAVKAIRAGRLPAFYAHYDHDWRTYNSQLVRRYRLEDYVLLMARVQASHKRLMRYLRTIPAVEFVEHAGLRFKGYKVTIAGELQVEIRDERLHLAQMQALASEAR
jgi:hypothetical protein